MSKARTMGSGLAMPWPTRGLRISCLSLLHLILPAYLGSDNRGRWAKPQGTGMLMVFHRRRKIGGVTEFSKVSALARSHGVTLMPHAPYFGPGLGAEPDPEVIKDYRDSITIGNFIITKRTKGTAPIFALSGGTIL
jgi:hypothetical protein